MMGRHTEELLLEIEKVKELVRDKWPKLFPARLNAWATARQASRELGLDFAAEQHLCHQLEQTYFMLEVDERGEVKIEIHVVNSKGVSDVVGGAPGDEQR